jgi:succinoglycan biosynthesis protein ExoO
VSVVIQAYNAQKTIRNAIYSVLEQTVCELEVIVVDDASTDGTVQAVEAVRDPRLRLLRSRRNYGPTAARNMGVKQR